MTDLIEKDGKKYRVDLEYDNSHDAPWVEEDGHGPVTDWERRAKAPGERILCEDRGARLFYDFQEAVRLARKDGWNCEPYLDTETAGQRAHKAATADYERLRRYCDGEWAYVFVSVTEVREDEDGEYDGPNTAIGDVESDSVDYIENSIVPDLIEELRSN